MQDTNQSIDPTSDQSILNDRALVLGQELIDDFKTHYNYKN